MQSIFFFLYYKQFHFLSRWWQTHNSSLNNWCITYRYTFKIFIIPSDFGKIAKVADSLISYTVHTNHFIFEISKFFRKRIRRYNNTCLGLGNNIVTYITVCTIITPKQKPHRRRSYNDNNIILLYLYFKQRYNNI